MLWKVIDGCTTCDNEQSTTDTATILSANICMDFTSPHNTTSQHNYAESI